MTKDYFVKITQTKNIFDIVRQSPIAENVINVQEFDVLSDLSWPLSQTDKFYFSRLCPLFVSSDWYEST